MLARQAAREPSAFVEFAGSDESLPARSSGLLSSRGVQALPSCIQIDEVIPCPAEPEFTLTCRGPYPRNRTTPP